MPYPPDNYPLTPAGVDDYPVKVGSMLLTLVDPHKGFESAYNRWYERDHFYAGCMEGPWQIAGSRWVATREMKNLRWGGTDVANPLDAGSYVAIYWVEAGHHKDWDDWALPQVQQLYANGRGFGERSHVHTATFDHVGAVYRDADPVPVELALDARYPGMVSLFVEPTGSQEAVDEWFDAYLPGWLDGSPVASIVAWTPEPLLDTKPDFVPVDPNAGERILHVHFVEDDPLEHWHRWERLAADLAESGVGTVVYASPFAQTHMGTDRYTDELWP
jgi:hypothetical protein